MNVYGFLCTNRNNLSFLFQYVIDTDVQINFSIKLKYWEAGQSVCCLYLFRLKSITRLQQLQILTETQRKVCTCICVLMEFNTFSFCM